MTNEEFVRDGYATAEVRDIPGWVACFNPGRVFVDDSVGVSYHGPRAVGKPVENYACRDVFRLKDGRIQLFDCYPSGTVILGQLGVLGNLSAVLQQPTTV